MERAWGGVEIEEGGEHGLPGTDKPWHPAGLYRPGVSLTAFGDIVARRQRLRFFRFL